MPEYFTNIEGNSHYKTEHRIPLNLFLENSPEPLTPDYYEDSVLLIKQNVRLDCRSENPDFMRAEGVIYQNRFYCDLSPVRVNFDLAAPEKVAFTVTASSKEASGYQRAETFKLNYLSQFKVLSRSKSFTCYKDDRSHTIEVLSSKDFKVKIPSSL